MAQDRFYFWRGYYDALRKLPTDEHRGEFVMAICAYAFDGEEPDFEGDAMLDFAWSLIADIVAESVELGRRRSEAGKMGGRPTKGKKKSTAKSSALSSAKSSVKSTAESYAESTAESVEYGNVLSPSATEREYDAMRASADAGAHASQGHAPQIGALPPRPSGEW